MLAAYAWIEDGIDGRLDYLKVQIILMYHIFMF